MEKDDDTLDISNFFTELGEINTENYREKVPLFNNKYATFMYEKKPEVPNVVFLHTKEGTKTSKVNQKNENSIFLFLGINRNDKKELVVKIIDVTYVSDRGFQYLNDLHNIKLETLQEEDILKIFDFSKKENKIDKDFVKKFFKKFLDENKPKDISQKNSPLLYTEETIITGENDLFQSFNKTEDANMFSMVVKHPLKFDDLIMFYGKNFFFSDFFAKMDIFSYFDIKNEDKQWRVEQIGSESVSRIPFLFFKKNHIIIENNHLFKTVWINPYILYLYLDLESKNSFEKKILTVLDYDDYKDAIEDFKQKEYIVLDKVPFIENQKNGVELTAGSFDFTDVELKKKKDD